jgi:hypothetical protein
MVFVGKPMLPKNIVWGLSMGPLILWLYIVNAVFVRAIDLELISFLVNAWQEPTFLNELLFAHQSQFTAVRATVRIYCLVCYFVLNQIWKDSREVNFDEVWNKVAMEPMPIVDAHHPEVLDVSEVILNIKWILICFLLPWNKPLSCFNRIHLYGAVVGRIATIFYFFHLGLILILVL